MDWLQQLLGPYLLAIIPNERRGEGTGYFAMSMNLAMAIGPFIGLLITQHFSFDYIFATATIFSIAALVATVFIRVPKIQQPKATKTGMKLSDFFEKKALPACHLNWDSWIHVFKCFILSNKLCSGN